MLTKRLLISIVTYNSKDIFDVLNNLRETLAEATFHRIVIFDNNSSEEYKNKLKEYSDIADIHFHKSNEGFGYGHNFNLLNAEEKYFLILNPDALITQDVMLDLMKVLEEDEKTALVVPKVLNSDGTTQYLVRKRVSVFDYSLRFIPFKWVKKLFDKRLSQYECRDLPDDQITTIRIGSGCCMLVDGEKFKELSGFDPRYFMYFEDYDFCLELEKKGYLVKHNPFTTIVHFYGKEAHKSFKIFRIFIKSMFQFFNKWGWKFF